MVVWRSSRKKNGHAEAGIAAEWNSRPGDFSGYFTHVCLKLSKCWRTQDNSNGNKEKALRGFKPLTKSAEILKQSENHRF